MKAKVNGLKVIHSGNGQDLERLSGSRLQIIASLVILAVLIVAAAQWPDRELHQTRQTPAQPDAAAQAEPVAFDYFPADYVNQATKVEPQIEAF